MTAAFGSGKVTLLKAGCAALVVLWTLASFDHVVQALRRRPRTVECETLRVVSPKGGPALEVRADGEQTAVWVCDPASGWRYVAHRYGPGLAEGVKPNGSGPATAGPTAE
jgi:hypothetical protein